MSRIEIPIGDEVLVGDREGTGAPALLLHGGAAISDYTDGLALELNGMFETVRYTQRGTLPSTVGGPFSIEAHMADALAVMDAQGWRQAWVAGHSWGGHLALHLAVAHPERLLGVVCICPLGATPDLFSDMSAALAREMSAAETARVDEIEQRRRDGVVTEADLMERWQILWPLYFADPAGGWTFPCEHVGVECSIGTNVSISSHMKAGTLVTGLPGFAAPALFVHGELDPLPPRSSLEAAALIPRAQVEIIAGRGHHPWLEQPGEVRAAVERMLDGARV